MLRVARVVRLTGSSSRLPAQRAALPSDRGGREADGALRGLTRLFHALGPQPPVRRQPRSADHVRSGYPSARRTGRAGLEVHREHSDVREVRSSASGRSESQRLVRGPLGPTVCP